MLDPQHSTAHIASQRVPFIVRIPHNIRRVRLITISIRAWLLQRTPSNSRPAPNITTTANKNAAKKKISCDDRTNTYINIEFVEKLRLDFLNSPSPSQIQFSTVCVCHRWSTVSVFAFQNFTICK